MINKEDNIFSVSDLNNYIKTLFDNTVTLKEICVKGQINNYKGKNINGHLYFSLIDDTSSLKVVIFKYDALHINVDLKDGDEVIVKGSISSYPPSGTYQIIGKELFPVGLSELLIKRKKLEEKLFKEGIFDESHKLKIPKFPNKIGVITGKNSAAEKDIITNIKRRFPISEIVICHSLVQGTEAPSDLIKCLKLMKDSDVDVLIIGRGGGSSEDLYAFDDEQLVREIYDYKIPTISAVGHEINRTFCDLVCDAYASTPTGAAELATPDKTQLIEDLMQTKSYLNSLIQNKISDLESKINDLKGRKFFNSLIVRNDSNIEKIKLYKTKIIEKVTSFLKEYELNLNNYKSVIDLLNPEEVIKKGYSIVFNRNNGIIKSINDIETNDNVKVILNDGYVIANVKEKKYGK